MPVHINDGTNLGWGAAPVSRWLLSPCTVDLCIAAAQVLSHGRISGNTIQKHFRSVR